MRRKILYLDRDGIINKHIPYVGTLERFHWHKEIFQITRIFNTKGFQIKVVTNQSGIQRGYYSIIDYTKICLHMLNKFEDYGIPQARHRIIIVGIKKELNLQFKVPKPSYKTITAKEALQNIPEDAYNNELTKNSEQVKERLK